MPRLPDDSPLLYSDKCGQLVPRGEWERGKDTCSRCGGENYPGYMRFCYGKWDTYETTDFICVGCLREEDALDDLMRAVKHAIGHGADETIGLKSPFEHVEEVMFNGKWHDPKEVKHEL